MGFHLNCVLALDASVLPLYDLVIPGGSAYAPRTGDPALPEGWVLPAPWELEHAVSGLAYEGQRLAPPALDAWRDAAGVPAKPDPLDAFDYTDLALGSFLSLAAPVVVISDSTFGGQLLYEYAAAFREGRLVAACGVDPDEGKAFRLDGGVFRAADPASVAPVTECAGQVHDGLRGADLFRGYLPRNANHEGRRRHEAWSGPMPSVDPAWHTHFPLLDGDRRAAEHVLGRPLGQTWPAGALAPGSRVVVVRDADWDGPWQAAEFSGAIDAMAAPEPNCHPQAREGELVYWVAFDSPQYTGDGDGPFRKAQVWGRYVQVEP
ncbi:hypothetical protein ACIQZN_05605 [Streptomyces sp. NPDC097595]|uniref:hypothetical protein n=1 Tax=Streptomyces sp. NPDC097595 TaxID=3366090 RepID=UPI00381DA33B